MPLRKFSSFVQPRLKGIRAYRTTKEIWGQGRTVVITRSEKLLADQIAGIKAALRKKRAALQELHQKLLQSQRPKAKGKGYSRESLKKRLDAITSGQYTAEILKTKILDRGGRLDFTFWIDSHAFENLKLTRLGKRILCTDNHSWTTEEIILGSQAQYHIENAFKQMKDPHWVSFSPAFHWTDQKLRVHAFYCILALMFSSLLQRKVTHLGIHLTIPPSTKNCRRSPKSSTSMLLAQIRAAAVSVLSTFYPNGHPSMTSCAESSTFIDWPTDSTLFIHGINSVSVYIP